MSDPPEVDRVKSAAQEVADAFDALLEWQRKQLQPIGPSNVTFELPPYLGNMALKDEIRRQMQLEFKPMPFAKRLQKAWRILRTGYPA